MTDDAEKASLELMMPPRQRWESVTASKLTAPADFSIVNRVMKPFKVICLVLVLMAFRINAQDAPPVITFSVPSPQQVTEGSNLTFVVTATDPEHVAITLTVSNWPPPAVFFSDDGLIGNGTETDTFTLIPSFGAHLGSPYDVVFVANDGVNAPVSKTMQIIVSAAVPKVSVMITNFSNRDGNFYFEMIKSGKQTAWTIEASTNLIDWDPIATNGPLDGCDCFTDLESTNFVQRFYRAVKN